MNNRGIGWFVAAILGSMLLVTSCPLILVFLGGRLDHVSWDGRSQLFPYLAFLAGCVVVALLPGVLVATVYGFFAQRANRRRRSNTSDSSKDQQSADSLATLGAAADRQPPLPTAPQKSFWQFTLRELLVVTILVALICSELRIAQLYDARHDASQKRPLPAYPGAPKPPAPPPPRT